MRGIVLGGIAVWLGLGIAGRTASADGDDAARLHVLLVADTSAPDIGESVRIDLDAVRAAIRWGVPEKRLAVQVLEGGDATPETILAQIGALPVSPEDTLLFYYSGHGAWADLGHYLRMTGGKVLERTRLVEAVRAKGARLAVVLTDCCGVYVGQTMFFAPPAPDPDVFRDLFFRHRGLVDVTAARKGQEAVGDEVQGGLFTRAFVHALTVAQRQWLDADRDGIVSWGETAERLSEQTEASFKRSHPRGLSVKGRVLPGQTPHVFDVATPPATPIPKTKPRLGVRVKPGGDAAVVEEVVPGSPAHWLGIERGDRIRSVRVPAPSDQHEDRDFPIQGAGHLDAALSAAPGSRLVAMLVTKAAGGDPEERWIRLGP